MTELAPSGPDAPAPEAETGVLDIHGTRLFELVLDFLFDRGPFAPGGEIGPKKVLGLQGGTRSGKTFAVNQALLVAAHDPRAQAEGWEFETVRAHLATLRATAMKDFFRDVLKPTGRYDEDDHNKSECRYQIGRCELGWLGADGQKTRGNSRHVLFCNEANELSTDEKRQLFQRTSLKIVLDWNPDEVVEWIEAAMRRPDAHLDISTYLDNPYAPEGQVEEVEAYVPTYVDAHGELVHDWDLAITEAVKAGADASVPGGPFEFVEGDENSWRVWGLGLEGTNEAQVYPLVRVVDAIPPDCEDVVYGLDFGFASPSALVKCAVRDVGKSGSDGPVRRELYWDEVLYAPRLSTPEIAEAALADMDADAAHEAARLGVEAASMRHRKVFCDHEGDRIDELVRLGVSAERAMKSVTSGIATVKRFTLCVTKRSANLMKERRKYRFQVDPRSGRLLDVVVKTDDHAMDAGRYGTHSRWGSTEAAPQIFV